MPEAMRDGLDNQFFSHVVTGMLRENAVLQYRMITDFVKMNYREILDSPEMARNELVDGIIVFNAVRTLLLTRQLK